MVATEKCYVHAAYNTYKLHESPTRADHPTPYLAPLRSGATDICLHHATRPAPRSGAHDQNCKCALDIRHYLTYRIHIRDALHVRKHLFIFRATYGPCQGSSKPPGMPTQLATFFTLAVFISNDMMAAGLQRPGQSGLKFENALFPWCPPRTNLMRERQSVSKSLFDQLSGCHCSFCS